MAHAMRALEDGRLTGDMVANGSLHPRQIIGVNKASPVRGAAHVLVCVPEHRLPTGREVHLVVLDVEIPESIVRGGLRKRRALFELRQPRLDTYAFQTGGEAGADE